MSTASKNKFKPMDTWCAQDLMELKIGSTWFHISKLYVEFVGNGQIENDQNSI